MKTRIVSAVEKGRLSDEIKGQHRGFSEWNSKVTNKDHQSIVQVISTLVFNCSSLILALSKICL